ncbi:exodeoxyribonuclease VII small subunit [Candidatus Marinamargulisbacteria bacterium SCGC AG-410-N11]|nr:exodeoxyribonuclease VII small subunit [Candidatus Marinamargulisbacteria bacterium SCGC AG-410-N11]
MSNKKNTLAKKIENLDQLVNQLESDSLSIEESIDCYQTAMSSTKDILSGLNSVKQQVAILKQDSNDLFEQDLEERE